MSQNIPVNGFTKSLINLSLNLETRKTITRNLSLCLNVLNIVVKAFLENKLPMTLHIFNGCGMKNCVRYYTQSIKENAERLQKKVPNRSEYIHMKASVLHLLESSIISCCAALRFDPVG